MFSILSRRCPCWLLLARPFLYAFHAHLRFPVDLVWFRLSCDHGWIRSGSVNVRKQQQTTTTRWAFLFFCFFVFSEKNPVCRDGTHVPTCQKVTRCRLSYRGRPAGHTTHQKDVKLNFLLLPIPE